VTVLAQLAATGVIDARVVGDAIRDLEIDPEVAPPRVQ